MRPPLGYPIRRIWGACCNGTRQESVRGHPHTRMLHKTAQKVRQVPSEASQRLQGAPVCPPMSLARQEPHGQAQGFALSMGALALPKFFE